MNRNDFLETHQRSRIAPTPEGTSFLAPLAFEAPIGIRSEDDYPTSSKSPLYNQSTSLAPGYILSSLTTVVVSRTTTVTLTTVALVTSEITITTPALTGAPMLSSTPTYVVLSAGQIAGIILGVITGLVLFTVLFYLFLTRAKWVPRTTGYWIERREGRYRDKSKRQPRETTVPAEKETRCPRSARSVRGDRRERAKGTVKVRPVSISTAPEQRQQELNDRIQARRVQRVRIKQAMGEGQRVRGREQPT
ncbi:hypothetical protein SAMD00023353_3800880 [Rosellinia necatrix]|uniref:Uncharacterized protein n=1 Tax=Rosellinia necatrix TaxID=77044 RepID=A0A1W2TMK0_ROSNE|nr:hypothetical protein SAMD00023353_3800880 [Rosellinia necatrix]